ncbi:MAG: hypothetical protein WCN85_11930 [Burkholderiales bacterium]
MMEWMMYLAISGGIALVTALGIAYDERVLGISCERRERNTVRREQTATRANMRGSGSAIGVRARPHPS